MAAAAHASHHQASLYGLLHAGGLLHDAPLQRQTPRLLREVFAPKASGAQLLRLHACYAAPLQHCVLFSSIAALTGPAGSANYAAANAVMDALAHRVQAQGRHCSPACLECMLVHLVDFELACLPD